MLYKIHKNEIQKASVVLADAFQHDTLWQRVFEGESDFNDKLRICFETPVKLCYTFGEVYATSNNFEGVAAWVPGHLSYMNMWRVLRSGAFFSGMKVGMKAGKIMGSAFGPMEKDRKDHMQGKPYMYLLIIGVATAYQGQGYGGKLLRYLIEKCDQSEIPLYLETETEENVRLYEKFGFKTIQKITLPVVEHPMWEMVRDP